MHELIVDAGVLYLSVQCQFRSSDAILTRCCGCRTQVLVRGGNFVVKLFHGADEREFLTKCKVLFKHVEIAKPPSSRSESAEVFVVCKNYTGGLHGRPRDPDALPDVK